MIQRRLLLCLLGLLVTTSVFAQERRQPPPQYKSTEFKEDGKVAFRVYAPKAESVRLSSSDIQFGSPADGELKKGDNGVWEVTVGPLPAGAYRYTFNVDGVNVLDTQNTSTSEANTTIFSLLSVPGSPLFDTAEVPHGALSEVTYYSKSLGRHRRAHVYTPPGYERNDEKYPVFYLLHGASDSDDSWSTVGRAGQILDNLIAAGKAKPMVVVMPNGHTAGFRFGPGFDFEKQMSEFETDFIKDLKPYIENNYRLINDRQHRAIAGLSMGGAQTLNIGFSNPDQFSYLGVYSSGVFGITGGFGGAPPSTAWEDKYKATLDNADLMRDLRTVWFATGKQDFLLSTSQKTVEMLKSHKLDVTYKETDGGHVWANWREYLGEFAPMLFQEKQ